MLLVQREQLAGQFVQLLPFRYWPGRQLVQIEVALAWQDAQLVLQAKHCWEVVKTKLLGQTTQLGAQLASG